ncbi:MAG: hypothetical protein ABR505_04255 [Actinomycetota bacterium]
MEKFRYLRLMDKSRKVLEAKSNLIAYFQIGVEGAQLLPGEPSDVILSHPAAAPPHGYFVLQPDLNNLACPAQDSSCLS